MEALNFLASVQHHPITANAKEFHKTHTLPTGAIYTYWNISLDLRGCQLFRFFLQLQLKTPFINSDSLKVLEK